MIRNLLLTTDLNDQSNVCLKGFVLNNKMTILVCSFEESLILHSHSVQAPYLKVIFSLVVRVT